MFSFDLITSPALKAKLAAASAVLGGSGMNAPLLAAAQLIVNAAQPKAAYLTGTLRRSIHAEVRGPGDVVVGSSEPYAARIEFGFIGPDKLGRHYHQAARPYLRPAIEENRVAVRDAVFESTMDLLRHTLT